MGVFSATRDKAAEGVKTKSRNLITAIAANKEKIDAVELKLIDSAAALDNIARDRLLLEQRVFEGTNALRLKEREHVEALALMPGLALKMRDNASAMDQCQEMLRDLDDQSKKINEDLRGEWTNNHYQCITYTLSDPPSPPLRYPD